LYGSSTVGVEKDDITVDARMAESVTLESFDPDDSFAEGGGNALCSIDLRRRIRWSHSSASAFHSSSVGIKFLH
jgi:hypothetical protein